MDTNHKFNRYNLQASPSKFSDSAFGYCAPYSYPISELASYCDVIRFNLPFERERFRVESERGFTPANDTPLTYYGLLDDGSQFVRHWARLNDSVRRKLTKPTLKKSDKFQRVAGYHADVREGLEVRVSERDVKVKVFNRTQTAKPRGGAKRGKVTEFSDSSRERLASHLVNLPSGSIKSFLTLTYPETFPTDGKSIKYHLQKMRQWFKRRGVSGVWFLEFQRRGAPHFHAFLSGFLSAESVAEQWVNVVSPANESEWVKMLAVHKGEARGHNSDKNRPCIELLRCSEAMQKYATKYAYKCEQKIVPVDFLEVGRFWGSWGGLKPVWHYYHALGNTANAAGLTIIQLFKEEMFNGFLSDFAIMSRNYSTTLRGGADVIKIMLDQFFNFRSWHVI